MLCLKKMANPMKSITYELKPLKSRGDCSRRSWEGDFSRSMISPKQMYSAKRRNPQEK